MTTPDTHTAACVCGQVKLETLGEPILATVCHCASCKEAGRQLERLQGASPILAEDGGTPFVLYRKDRVRPVQGASLLAEHRLKPESPTRRVVATCCNTMMFLDFTRGHWVSIVHSRLPVACATTDQKSGKFALRLVSAWAGMRFQIPKIDYVKGRI